MQRRTFLRGLVAASAATSLPTVTGDPVHAGSGSKHHRVLIRGFAFVPENLVVKPGDRITWTNEDIVIHTATAVDESWDTGSIESGASHTLTVEEDMSPDYFCLFHPSMVAKLSI